MKKAIFALAFALLLSAPNAFAANIDYQGFTKGQVVNITTTGLSPNVNGNVYAVQQNWCWDSSTAAPTCDGVGEPSGYTSPYFYAYCVDVNHTLADPQTITAYTFNTADNLQSGEVAGAGKKAAWLLNAYGAAINAATTASTVMSNGYTASINAAALQVAIWEAIYDTTNNLTSGTFKLNVSSTTNGASIQTSANSYLTALYSAISGNDNGWPTASATWLQATDGAGQDLITGNPSGGTQSTVPEPTSLVLLGSGLLGIGRTIRRRRSA